MALDERGHAGTRCGDVAGADGILFVAAAGTCVAGDGNRDAGRRILQRAFGEALGDFSADGAMGAGDFLRDAKARGLGGVMVKDEPALEDLRGAGHRSEAPGNEARSAGLGGRNAHVGGLGGVECTRGLFKQVFWKHVGSS